VKDKHLTGRTTGEPAIIKLRDPISKFFAVHEANEAQPFAKQQVAVQEVIETLERVLEKVLKDLKGCQGLQRVNNMMAIYDLILNSAPADPAEKASSQGSTPNIWKPSAPSTNVSSAKMQTALGS
jgi:hypothetical protein